MSSASDVTYNLYVGTCKMESDDSEGIQDLPVTFEVNLPNDMNTDEVISLIEALQSDIEGFHEMILDAVIHEEENEAEQKRSH